jgi:hypothetical protein
MHAGVFKVKFNRDVNTQLETFKWRVGLIIMGKVREKISTSAYKMMNQL